MRKAHYFFLPLGLALALSACSSGDGNKGSANPSPTGGSASQPVGGNAGTGNSSGLGLAGGGGKSSSSTSTEPITAEQTPDGILPITPSQAISILANPDTACAGWVEEPEGTASVVEFMVDVSGSMLKTTESTGTASKWAVTQTALHETINALPATLPVGLTFFPNMRLSAAYQTRPTSACVDTSDDVMIAPLSDEQRLLLTSTVDAMRANPNGATPTHDAFTVALANLASNTDPGQKYVVLITDGQPTQSLGCIGSGVTCTPEPTAPVVQAIQAARDEQKVKTFIVGSPGSEKNDCTNADVRDWLSAAARAGGTEAAGCSDTGPTYCHFDLSTADDFGVALAGALGEISRSVVSCDYVVPPPPPGETISTDRVNMIYEDGAGGYSLVLPSAATTCERGWQFTDDSLTKIRVCSQTCELLQENPMAKIALVFGCVQSQIGQVIQ